MKEYFPHLKSLEQETRYQMQFSIIRRALTIWVIYDKM